MKASAAYERAGITAAEHHTLESAWGTPRGLLGFLSSINHKVIGRRYIVTAFGFFVAGGILAALMRLQLARPERTRCSAPISTTRSSPCTARP